MHRKCCLLVLDGYGCNESPEKSIVDGIERASPECINSLSQAYPSTLLYAHGTHVGLASDEMMGNSEVGHLTLGAGRVVLQDSVRIRKTLSSHADEVVDKVLHEKKECMHILGILSDGGIHGHWLDVLDLSRAAAKKCERVYVHSISDGRDTRPAEYLKYLDMLLAEAPENVWVVSVSGRFYAMDRDKRDERTQMAYSAYTEGSAHTDLPKTRSECASRIREHLERSYSEGVTDEFIQPLCLAGVVKKGETLVISNFRADRARQIYACMDKHADVYTMTRLCPDQRAEKILFHRPEIANTLGDVLESSGKTQARVSETEKQAHVTFFFDGGKDKARKNETREIHPSRKVNGFDEVPEMEAAEISASVRAHMEKGTDFILANFANCDMVGHTGLLEPTIQAVKAVDAEIHKIYLCAKKHNYGLVITADHGNAEIMEDARGVVKSHTVNRVPAITITNYSDRDATAPGQNAFARPPIGEHTLADVAPTVLRIMGLPQPAEMTGTPLPDAPTP
ncbi:2,3-bisphosphoglycerate-independent phosphoglycerate mutase [Nematocida major]|uniref:2,3-bisphosphoglycerate-independent phosphoglycerate mutase n=1 Tax=Nematocida major TaxID=1912982 RepID=UPI00200862A7|nr:2,3-bisphosphoglycerate-independent phosphoglycerate mutase [Nematocida major]KAH9386467.1 2,3-bisphosphoglycerate-independent phosphoglycerate mutase [Nematocida major]